MDMPLPRILLKKAAEKLAKKKKVEKKVEKKEQIEEPKKSLEIRDIGKALEELDKYLEKGPEEDLKRIEKVKKSFALGNVETVEKKKKEKLPTVIDFSKISTELPSQTETRAEKRTEKGIDIWGIKNIPLKAHKIPRQYLKKMSVEWRPPELQKINLRYPLIEPFAFANLSWNPDKNRLEYFVLEPFLTEEQRRNLELIKELVVDLLDVNLFEIKESASIKKVLKEKVDRVISDYGIKMTEDEYQKILYYMYRDFLGLERIEPLMHDPSIEDISCDGINIPIYIYHRKYASIPTNIMFEDEDELNRFVIRLAQKCGKHISVAEPLLDGALPDGSRVQATYSSHKDIAMRGSTFTIRKFTRDPLTIIDLLNFGTLPEMMAAYLWLALEYKKSILVSGGTATGKTSMLNALSMFIPGDAKIVSIEDTPEIRLPHEHWVQKVVRPGFGRADITGVKMGEITMYDLLRAALRERPDCLIVGEVRGKEAYVLFQGMATGHTGLATIHADSVDAVMNRLQTPPINLSPGLLQHLDIILILTKARIKGVEVRRVKELVEVLGLTKEHEPIINTLFRWDPATDSFEFVSDRSYVLQDIIETKGIEEKSVWEELQRRTQILRWMRENDIRYFVDVGRIIQQYYSTPDEVLKKL